MCQLVSDAASVTTLWTLSTSCPCMCVQLHNAAADTVCSGPVERFCEWNISFKAFQQSFVLSLTLVQRQISVSNIGHRPLTLVIIGTMGEGDVTSTCTACPSWWVNIFTVHVIADLAGSNRPCRPKTSTTRSWRGENEGLPPDCRTETISTSREQCRVDPPVACSVCWSSLPQGKPSSLIHLSSVLMWLQFLLPSWILKLYVYIFC